jgi:hypothetical protein
MNTQNTWHGFSVAEIVNSFNINMQQPELTTYGNRPRDWYKVDWAYKRYNDQCKNKVAFFRSKNNKGYYQTTFVNGKILYLHQLMAMAYGIWDSELKVDHANGIVSDNSFLNLRMVTNSVNSLNRKRSKYANLAIFQKLINVEITYKKQSIGKTFYKDDYNSDDQCRRHAIRYRDKVLSQLIRAS